MGGASNIWRLSLPANAATGSGSLEIAEIEMRATPGGADQCTGGTASASGAPSLVANAFDNNNSTGWFISDTAATWIQYTFPAPVEVRQLALTSAAIVEQAPNSFTLQYYDGSAYQTAASFAGVTWTSTGQLQTFDVPAIPAAVIVSEIIAMSPSAGAVGTYNKAVTESINTSLALEAVRTQSADLVDTLTLSVATQRALGAVITEGMLIGLDQITNSSSQVALGDTLTLLDALSKGIPVEVAETINLTAAWTAAQAVSVIEALALADTLVPIFAYNLSIDETVNLATSLGNFFGVDISETVGVAETVGATAWLNVTIDESVDVTETLSPQLVINATITDTLSIDDVDILNMIYSGTIAEGIELSAAYISPGTGTVTTWAMNTRSGAVTEYSNYAFNSFARLGNKYLGASRDGLYELVGDDDDGTDIIAQIKSGFAQWAGNKFTMFKGVYLGLRGGGEFVLKLTTGDGKSYHYGVSARDMRTTKVAVGKGLRSRYFAFELISAGQDFDLDTIEFVPLVAERRV
jgi:hypothetical protein